MISLYERKCYETATPSRSTDTNHQFTITPPEVLTARPRRKKMVDRRSFPFGARSFFRGDTPENKPDNGKASMNDMNEDVSPRLYLLSKKLIFPACHLRKS